MTYAPSVEKIISGELVLAILLRREFKTDGINFLTPDSYSQQLGYMNRPAGYVIEPHVHSPVIREVEYTNEVLLIKTGQVRADFYDPNQTYLKSRILNQGDVILLICGGHGFTMIENSEIIEIKQGPYVGDADKTRFSAVDNNNLILK